MKNAKQQELCKLIETFTREKNGEAFQQVLNALFRCPLLFPVGKDENKGKFLMIEQDGVKHMSGFTDMDEVKQESMGDVQFVPFTLEEYAKVLAETKDVKGLVINIFNKENCVINREFFADVVVPAFANKAIMPGLEAEDGTLVTIHKMPFTIGRNPNADLTLEENTINDLHAVIIEREEHYYVVDKNSLNGTYVNGREVPKNGELEIVYDDVIEFFETAYTFVPMGLANRQQVLKSIYGDDRVMIANGVYLAQNSLLMKEFFLNTEKFTETMKKDEEGKQFQQFLMMGLEMTCAMKEKEQKVEDEKVIKEQRMLMLRKGMTIFDKNDYGFTQLDTVGVEIYVAKFPAYLHLAGMAKRMYFVIQEDGTKCIYMVKVDNGKSVLTKVSEDHTETACGDAPTDETEELKAIADLAAQKE